MLKFIKLNNVAKEFHKQTTNDGAVGESYTYRKVIDALSGKKEVLTSQERNILKKIVKDACDKTIEKIDLIIVKPKK